MSAYFGKDVSFANFCHIIHSPLGCVRCAAALARAHRNAEVDSLALNYVLILHALAARIRNHPQDPGAHGALRSLLRIDHFTAATESAQIIVTAMDLSGRRHAEGQVVPPLAAGSDHLAAALTT